MVAVTPTANHTTSAGPHDIGLDGVLNPVSLPDFFESYWEAKPLHVPGDTSRFEALLSIGDIDQLASAAPTVKGQRGVLAVRSEAGETVQHPLGSAGSTVQMAQVNQAFDAGYTIVINHLPQIHKGVSTLCADATGHLQHPVGCNLYLTPRKARGFLPHRDYQDTFFLQLHGEKQWNLWAPEEELPVRKEPVEPIAPPTRPPDHIVQLTQGDVLYLPRGWIHAGETHQDLSLHITLGAKVLTWADALHSCVDQLSQSDRRLREALPLASQPHANVDSERVPRMHQAVIELLGSLTETVDVSDALVTMMAERLESHIPPIHAGLSNALRRSELTPATWLERVSGLHPVLVHESDATTKLVFQGGHVSGPALAAEAMAFVAACDRFQPCELPGLPADAQLGLVDQLLLQGLVRPC